MAQKREKIEKRIYEILRLTKKEELILQLDKNINNFSDEDLELILEYLESWNLSFMNEILNKKLREYKAILCEVKNEKISAQKKKSLEEEKEEKGKEIKELEKLINF